MRKNTGRSYTIKISLILGWLLFMLFAPTTAFFVSFLYFFIMPYLPKEKQLFIPETLDYMLLAIPGCFVMCMIVFLLKVLEAI